MNITTVVVSKTDTEEIKNMAINVTDTAAPDDTVVVNIDYSTLDAGEKTIADQFYAMAASKIPA